MAPQVSWNFMGIAPSTKPASSGSSSSDITDNYPTTNASLNPTSQGVDSGVSSEISPFVINFPSNGFTGGEIPSFSGNLPTVGNDTSGEELNPSIEENAGALGGLGNVAKPEDPQQNASESDVMSWIEQQFDSLDKNGNGFLEPDELAQIKSQAEKKFGAKASSVIDQMISHMNELIFANIDPGKAAWFGLSKKDIQGLGSRTKNGESISSIASSLRQQVANERGVSSDQKGFDQYVKGVQVGHIWDNFAQFLQNQNNYPNPQNGGVPFFNIPPNPTANQTAQTTVDPKSKPDESLGTKPPKSAS